MIVLSNAAQAAGCSSTGSRLIRSISASTTDSAKYPPLILASDWNSSGNHPLPVGQSAQNPPGRKLMGAFGSFRTVSTSSVDVANGLALKPAASRLCTSRSVYPLAEGSSSAYGQLSSYSPGAYTACFNSTLARSGSLRPGLISRTV